MQNNPFTLFFGEVPIAMAEFEKMELEGAILKAGRHE